MSADNQTYSAIDEVAVVVTRRTWPQRVWRALKKAPMTAWFGMVVIFGYLVTAIFAPWIAPSRAMPDTTPAAVDGIASRLLPDAAP